MFDEPLPGCGEFRQYCGGLQGLVAYGHAFRILAKIAHLSRVPDETDFITIDMDAADRIFRQAAGVPLSRSRSPFVHVAAAAIHWAWNHLVPPPNATIRGLKAREIYRCVFARTVRAYATAYAKLTRMNFDEWARRYARRATQDGNLLSWLDGRFGDKLPADLLSGQAGDGTCNTAGYIFGFWLRRHLDGTDRLLAGYLFRFLKLYDPAFASSLGLQIELAK